MRTAPRAAVAAVVLAGTVVATVHGQSAHALTPAERVVVGKFVGVLEPLLDRFGNENWKKTSDFYTDLDHTTASIHPSVPIDLHENFERTYKVPEDSPRFQTLMMPLVERLQKLDVMDAANAPTFKRLSDRFHALQEVTVHVQANRWGLQADWAQVGTPSLPIAGPAIAHDVTGNDCGDDREKCYVMAFGNWGNAIRHGTGKGASLQFKFANPPDTPHIENAVIYVRGADDRIQELFKTLDWTKINDGLSP